MKKAAHNTPKQRLKEERELRGWSQKYLAEQIGADHYYLSRWERGAASPSPYYCGMDSQPQNGELASCLATIL